MTWYLKYRPQSVDELDLISVREALKKNLFGPHAFLLSGPRGLGKTSAARIMAKELNGNDPDLNKQIERGSCIDVIEMDAASNRGIDEIRTLKDQVNQSPLSAKVKVYIIDEAHMLTTEAANALLKTLEEPPVHVVFILCTTDPEKLPETVISRCTRIQFKAPTLDEIMSKLKFVAKSEKLKVESDELEILAKESKGSFRDAIKLLEQLAASGKSAMETIGLSVASTPQKFLEILRSKKTQPGLDFVNGLVEEGVNLRIFIEKCVECLRQELLQTLDKNILTTIWAFEKAYESSKTTTIPQLPLEILIISHTSPSVPKNITPLNPPLTPHLAVRIERGDVRGGNPKGEGDTPVVPGDVQLILDKWQEILRVVRPFNHSVEALLRSTRPIAYDGKNLLLEVFYQFHKDKLETDKCRQIVENGISLVLNHPGVILKLQLGHLEKKSLEPPAEDLVAQAAAIFK